MKTIVSFFAATVIFWSLVGADTTKMMTLFCTGEDRFVINFPGKNGILLEQGAGKKVCVSVRELFLLLEKDNIVDVLTWLNQQHKQTLTFDFYVGGDGTNIILVTKKPQH